MVPGTKVDTVVSGGFIGFLNIFGGFSAFAALAVLSQILFSSAGVLVVIPVGHGRDHLSAPAGQKFSAGWVILLVPLRLSRCSSFMQISSGL